MRGRRKTADARPDSPADCPSQLLLCEERLRLAIETANLGFFDWNICEGAMFLSEQWKRQLGYEPDEIPNLLEELESRIHPDDRERVLTRVREYVANSYPGYEQDYRLRHKDGTYRTMQTRAVLIPDKTGKPCRMICTQLDVTWQSALRESESFFRQTLESTPGMVFTTRPDGFCDYQSQQWTDFTGVPMSEHMGDGWNKLLHPEDQPRAFAAWRKAVEGHAPYDLEYRVRRYDGEYEWFKVQGRPIRNSSGQIVRWFGTALNIEGLKRAEARLLASLQEKEVLLQEVHHRVKNNLQVISSLINLQADTMDKPVLKASLQDVRDRVRSMALVHEKLYQSHNLARLDFAEYTSGLLHYLWRAHNANSSRLKLVLDTQPVTLPIDTAIPCGLIVNELATNALRHAFNEDEEGTVTVGLNSDLTGRRVTLWVADTGAGMPQGLDWQKPRSLGLQLVQMLTRQIGGNVEIKSQSGTEFRISFPLHPA